MRISLNLTIAVLPNSRDTLECSLRFISIYSSTFSGIFKLHEERCAFPNLKAIRCSGLVEALYSDCEDNNATDLEGKNRMGSTNL